MSTIRLAFTVRPFAASNDQKGITETFATHFNAIIIICSTDTSHEEMFGTYYGAMTGKVLSEDAISRLSTCTLKVR